jgi:hypothetical protein
VATDGAVDLADGIAALVLEREPHAVVVGPEEEEGTHRRIVELVRRGEVEVARVVALAESDRWSTDTFRAVDKYRGWVYRAE